MSQIWAEVWILIRQTLFDLAAAASVSLPRIVVALIVLAAGRLVAAVVRKVSVLLLRLIGVDVLLRRFRSGRALEDGSLAHRPSELMGVIAYWVVILGALAVSFDVLEFDAAMMLLQRILLFIPQLIAAILLLALGWHLAQFVGSLAEDATRASGLPAPVAVRLLGQVSIAILVTLVLVENLKLGGTTLTIVLFSVLFPVTVGLTVAVVMGSRSYVSNLIATHQLHARLQKGQRIRLDDVTEGQVLEIGSSCTSIETEKGLLILPNVKLVDRSIYALPSSD